MVMRQEAFESSAANGGNPRIAPQDLPAARTSPVTVESGAADYAMSSSVLVEQWQQEIQVSRRGELSDEMPVLELVRHVRVHGDQAARVEVEQYLGKIVLAWLRCHLSREAAWSFEGKEHFVALAFERFWQIIVQGQVTCETLAEVLACLRASLYGAILEAVRVSSTPRVVSSLRPDVKDHSNSGELWDRLEALLPNRREQRLGYLLYHCGLGPPEIVRFCPQEWSDVQEIYCLRRSILERLLTNANQFRSWLPDFP
jgi:hypothetical protein